jgi:monoamine oxidase
LYAEWTQEQDQQYRIPGGYAQLTDALFTECRGLGARILLNTTVAGVAWERNKVIVSAENGEPFYASQVLVTLPVGLWHLPEGSKGRIQFTPALPQKEAAAASIGFGTVTKILMEWHQPFWEAAAGKAGFMFGKTPVPTWWTHYPETDRLLTGWLSGPNARDLQTGNGEALVQLALDSLSSLCSIDRERLSALLINTTIFDWSKEEFTRGAYSFPTAQDGHAHEALAAPVEDTLFFAGEACYAGAYFGTVEAAINSGMAVVPGLLDAGFVAGK